MSLISLPLTWTNTKNPNKKIETSIELVHKNTIPTSNDGTITLIQRIYYLTIPLESKNTLFSSSCEIYIKNEEKQSKISWDKNIQFKNPYLVKLSFQKLSNGVISSNNLDKKKISISLFQNNEEFKSDYVLIEKSVDKPFVIKKRKKSEGNSIGQIAVPLVWTNSLDTNKKFISSIEFNRSSKKIERDNENHPTLVSGNYSYDITIENSEILRINKTAKLKLIEAEEKLTLLSFDQAIINQQRIRLSLKSLKSNVVSAYKLDDKMLRLSISQDNQEFHSEIIRIIKEYTFRSNKKIATNENNNSRQTDEENTNNQIDLGTALIPQPISFNPTPLSAPPEITTDQPPIFPSSFTPVLNPNFSFPFANNQHPFHHSPGPLITSPSSISTEQIQDFLASRTQIIYFHEITSPTTTPASSSTSGSAASSLGNSESEGADSTLPITSTTATSVGNLPRSDTLAIFDSPTVLISEKDIQEFLDQQ